MSLDMILLCDGIALCRIYISLLGNRLTGPIPVELANITTLERLVLQFNQFNGTLPPELGNLARIEMLHLSSNNFTGELPKTYARLTSLTEFRISDNQFSGSIPDFIQKWTNLEILAIQGSGLSGPIPSGISFLQNITDLRISDLSGYDSTFPQVGNLKGLKTLILRSCNINDTLPQNLANLADLQVLDLSFNKLSGSVPRNHEGLTGATYIPVSCESSTRICTTTFNSLHINCGGRKTTIGGITYEEDTDLAVPAVYKQSRGNWAYSNSGHFLDNSTASTRGYFLPYISQNETRLYMTDTELYRNARISPNSLTYYGFCLENGDYSVKLHFAEIMFTDDNTFRSLGRRVFDVYIQVHELRGLDLQTGLFTLRQIKAATNNFDICNKIGEGGFGAVYKYVPIPLSNQTELCFPFQQALLLKEEGNLMELVDQRLGSDFNEEEVRVMIEVALLCTNMTSSLRPTMSSVLSMLEGRTTVPELVSYPGTVMNEMDAMRQFYNMIQENEKSEIRSLSLSFNEPWTGSSSSVADLNHFHHDASYLDQKKLRETV
ncbi:unnamed protein product [Lupinus luteus]|uniref:non-specific serine/threonine protein kinase n=1 Tax=Lupinus luteus TaxID=3873 RepID=A0AAV1XXS4_LUPLU